LSECTLFAKISGPHKRQLFRLVTKAALTRIEPTTM
jgi:hypothetical protein